MSHGESGVPFTAGQKTSPSPPPLPPPLAPPSPPAPGWWPNQQLRLQHSSERKLLLNLLDLQVHLMSVQQNLIQMITFIFITHSFRSFRTSFISCTRSRGEKLFCLRKWSGVYTTAVFDVTGTQVYFANRNVNAYLCDLKFLVFFMDSGVGGGFGLHGGQKQQCSVETVCWTVREIL